jgi:GNAT superfamily N-acetyltransferase
LAGEDRAAGRAASSGAAAPAPAPSGGPDAAGGVIPAGPGDLDVLGRVIAEAFHDLPPSRWLIPDEDARREIFPGYFRLFVEHALAAGVVQTVADRTAVALWLPGGDDAAAPPADYDARLAALTAPWTGRFTAFDEALETRHPAGVRHQHLAMIAVRPGRQGAGTGTALLLAYHERLDRGAGHPAYLEAASPRTRQVYLRHGYADHGPPVDLPGGPPMYPMWRDPHGAGGPVSGPFAGPAG